MAFVVNDRVKVFPGNHNVRTAPDQSLPYTTVPENNQGVITDGPTPDAHLEGVEHYRINWDNNTYDLGLTDGSWLTSNWIVLVSPAPGEISGKVEDALGVAIEGATVTVDGFSVETDENGDYFIIDLAPGEYTVLAEADGFVADSQPATVVTAAVTTLDFTLQPQTMQPRGTIAGFVRDVFGVAIAGASVVIDQVATTVSAADGGFVLDDLQADEYTVTVSKSPFDTQDVVVPVVVGQLTPLNVTLHDFVPSPGGLTSAEKTSVQNLIWAAFGQKAGDVGSLHDGVAAALGLVTRDQTNSGTRDELTAVWRKVVEAQHTVSLALSDLLGGSVSPSGMPRSFYVDRAKDYINTAKGLVSQVQSLCDAAIAAGCDSFKMGRMKTLHAAGALTKLNAFNMSLSFSNPYPPDRGPGGQRITIIGPHGDYIRCQTWLTTAFDRLNRMYVACVDGYAADALLSGYNNKYQQLKFASLLVQKVGVTAGTCAGLQFSGYSADPFFRILSIFENLTHGGGGPVTADNDCSPDFCHAASYDFNNMKIWTQGDAGQEATRPTFKAKQALVLSEVTEAWQATDTAAWYMLKFPECEVTGGCGGT